MSIEFVRVKLLLLMTNSFDTKYLPVNDGVNCLVFYLN